MIARRFLRAASTLLVAAGLLLGAIMVLPALAGYERYVIVSGSMTGSYDRGSVVFAEVVPVDALKEGDVITFKPPGGDHLVTHRIASVTTGKDGALVFRTKGDANKVADPWSISLPGPKQARVRAGLPYVGYAVSALSDRRVRMLVIGLPAALIALTSLASLWREPEPEGARA
jgi:signal peptidase